MARHGPLGGGIPVSWRLWPGEAHLLPHRRQRPGRPPRVPERAIRVPLHQWLPDLRPYAQRQPLSATPWEAMPPLPSLHEFMFTLARMNFWLFGWPSSFLLVLFVRGTPGGLRLLGSVLSPSLCLRLRSRPAVLTPVGPVHYSELAVPLVNPLSERPGASGRAGPWRDCPWDVTAACCVMSGPVCRSTLCALVTFYPGVRRSS